MTKAETAASNRLLPWLVAVAFLLQSLDTTVLNTAVPSIARALDVSQLQLKSVLASYALSLAVFIPASGWVADRFGTRKVFAAAIAVFTLGSILCGFSRSIPELVAFRLLQGVGGAMMVPVGRLTMVRSFPKAELVRAMSFVVMPSMIGPLIGPTLGGFIVSVTSWDYIFFINVPVGIAGLVMVYFWMPDYREANVPRFDLLGLIYFGGGISLLSWVLEVFGEHGAGPSVLAFATALSVCLLAAYALHARKLQNPLLDLTLLKIRTFASSVLGGFVTRLGVGGAPFLLPLLYQSGLGYSPVQSGLLMMPQAAGALGSKIFVQYALAAVGYRTLLLGNTILLGIMLILFGTIGPATPAWLICVQGAVYGILMSTQFTAMNTLTFADVPDAKSSGASSLSGMFQQLSMSFGIAAARLVTASFAGGAGSEPAQMIASVRHGFWFLGAVTIVSASVFAVLKRDDGENVSGHRDAPAIAQPPSSSHAGTAQTASVAAVPNRPA